jgi:hypothetical protein
MEYYVRQCLVGVPHISIHLSLDGGNFDDVSTLRSSFLAGCLPCGPGEMRAESKVCLAVSVAVSRPVSVLVLVPVSVSASLCLCLSVCAHTFVHTYIHIHIHTYHIDTYMHIYVCVCVCVRARVRVCRTSSAVWCGSASRADLKSISPTTTMRKSAASPAPRVVSVTAKPCEAKSQGRIGSETAATCACKAALVCVCACVGVCVCVCVCVCVWIYICTAPRHTPHACLHVRVCA